MLETVLQDLSCAARSFRKSPGFTAVVIVSIALGIVCPFLEKTVYNAPFGILVTMHDGVRVPDPRIVCVSLRSLLLLR